MKQIDSILRSNLTLRRDNVINDNNNLLDNDTNDIVSNRKKYSLNKETFTPNTPETQLGEEIAKHFDDLDNYASYLNVVNDIGCDKTHRLFRVVKANIIEKSKTRTPVRKPPAYFMWVYKMGFY